MEKFETLWNKAVGSINRDSECNIIYDFGQRGRGASHIFPNKNFKTVNINVDSHPDIVADAHDTKLATGSAGAILSLSLLEHCHSPHVVVEEMSRILQPRGYILVTVPFMHPYHGGYEDGVFWPDYWRFTKDGLEYLFRNFEIEMGSDGGIFFAATEFIPAKMRWLEPLVVPVLRFFERLYSDGQSRHAYIIFGRKK